MALEPIHTGFYALPNGDVFFFKYDANGNGEGKITIGLRDNRYRVTNFERSHHEGLLIHIEKAEVK